MGWFCRGEGTDFGGIMFDRHAIMSFKLRRRLSRTCLATSTLVLNSLLKIKQGC